MSNWRFPKKIRTLLPHWPVSPTSTHFQPLWTLSRCQLAPCALLSFSEETENTAPSWLVLHTSTHFQSPPSTLIYLTTFHPLTYLQPFISGLTIRLMVTSSRMLVPHWLMRDSRKQMPKQMAPNAATCVLCCCHTLPHILKYLLPFDTLRITTICNQLQL